MIVFGIFNYIIQAKNNASKIDGMGDTWHLKHGKLNLTIF